MEIKNGSRWWSNDGRIFVVISTALLEEKEWVYYRTERPIEHLPKEFSCYKESFISRFSLLPE